ncbi:hypothetical protein BpHYR1_030719 [Brachionus plicatilis]|uniref:Uncharacterized protein n=1 Tax=Brachionus plicatilis TaxID=10195 RepID=A0A3M7SQH4_BRAPC|nr:hypothetical protein BpHYR1_030719 [Brachionus plicatilis]
MFEVVLLRLTFFTSFKSKAKKFNLKSLCKQLQTYNMSLATLFFVNFCQSSVFQNIYSGDLIKSRLGLDLRLTINKLARSCYFSIFILFKFKLEANSFNDINFSWRMFSNLRNSTNLIEPMAKTNSNI